jgi:peroxiredoxin
MVVFCALALTFLKPKAPSILLADTFQHQVSPIQPGTVSVSIVALKDCPICRKFSTEIRSMIHDFPTVHFSVVLVDSDGTLADLRQFRADYQLPCPVLLDKQHKWLRFTGATVAPTAVAFDRGSFLRYKGRIDDRFPKLGVQWPEPKHRDLRSVLKALLTGRSDFAKVTTPVGCYVSP